MEGALSLTQILAGIGRQDVKLDTLSPTRTRRLIVVDPERVVPMPRMLGVAVGEGSGAAGKKRRGADRAGAVDAAHPRREPKL